MWSTNDSVVRSMNQWPDTLVSSMTDSSFKTLIWNLILCYYYIWFEHLTTTRFFQTQYLLCVFKLIFYQSTFSMNLTFLNKHAFNLYFIEIFSNTNNNIRKSSFSIFFLANSLFLLAENILLIKIILCIRWINTDKRGIIK
jgi:hypothetical protein